MSLTFGLETPRNLFNKLRRDAQLLDDEVTSDRFFNFVVTGYCIIDWVYNGGTEIPAAARQAAKNMHYNTYVKICGDLANAVKHFKLDRRTPITKEATSNLGAGRGRAGVGGAGIGEEEIIISMNDGSIMNCLDFTAKVIEAWEAFFAQHGM